MSIYFKIQIAILLGIIPLVGCTQEVVNLSQVVNRLPILDSAVHIFLNELETNDIHGIYCAQLLAKEINDSIEFSLISIDSIDFLLSVEFNKSGHNSESEDNSLICLKRIGQFHVYSTKQIFSLFLEMGKIRLRRDAIVLKDLFLGNERKLGPERNKKVIVEYVLIKNSRLLKRNTTINQVY